MDWRNWLAKKLSPQMDQDAQRYRRLRSQMTNDCNWLGEFPDIQETIDRFLINDRDYWRRLEEPSSGYLYSDISAFREKLRQAKANLEKAS